MTVLLKVFMVVIGNNFFHLLKKKLGIPLIGCKTIETDRLFFILGDAIPNHVAATEVDLGIGVLSFGCQAIDTSRLLFILGEVEGGQAQRSFDKGWRLSFYFFYPSFVNSFF